MTRWLLRSGPMSSGSRLNNSSRSCVEFFSVPWGAGQPEHVSYFDSISVVDGNTLYRHEQFCGRPVKRTGAKIMIRATLNVSFHLIDLNNS